MEVVNDMSRTMAATIAGAAVGGAIGYLFFSPSGRAMRREIEPAIEDLAREIASFRTTVQKAAGVANDGWRLLNEVTGAIGDEAPRRYPTPHQNSPF
jgi:hypothetical protein